MEKNGKLVDTGCRSLVLTKLFRIMKLYLLLTILTITNVLANESYSQITRLSLDFKDAPVKEVLLDIESNSEFYFLYSNKLIDVDRRVDIQMSNKKIEDILNELFKGEGVTYAVSDRQIILSPEGMSLKNPADASQQKVITGNVVSEDGEPLDCSY